MARYGYYAASLMAGAGPSAISAPYWRLRFPDGAFGGDDQRMALKNVEMRATVGGADQTSGGTAFASQDHGFFGPAERAFDGDMDSLWTTWDSGSHYNAHIGYHFATSVEVAQIVVKASNNPAYSPRAIMVEYSNDGTAWLRFSEITGLSAWTADETRSYSLVDWQPPSTKAGYRYWKIEVTASNDGAGDVLAQEIELRATIGGSDMTMSSAIAQASGSAGYYDSGEAPARAFNNNTGDWWQPRIIGGTPVYAVWDFGADNDRQVNQIRWIAHGSYLGRTPNTFKVYGSHDGSSWTEDWTPINCGTWSSADRTFNRV